MTSLADLDLGRIDTWPTKRAEGWRWSDLRAALPWALDVSEAVPALKPAVSADVQAVFANGRAAAGASQFALGQSQRLALEFVSSGAGRHQSAVSVSVAGGAEAELVETYVGAGAYAAAVTLEIEVGVGAHLTRILVIDEPDTAVSLNRAEIALQRGARFTQVTLTRGAKLSRFETIVRHQGDGAEVQLYALSWLNGKRHADLLSEVHHLGPGGRLEQRGKAVVTGRSRTAFQGLIHVALGADRTDAKLKFDGLILEEGAEIDAKPELEIFADDVVCAHGTAIGALDPEALFYLESRGLDPDQARTLLTEAFAADILGQIADPTLRAEIASRFGFGAGGFDDV